METPRCGRWFFRVLRRYLVVYNSNRGDDELRIDVDTKTDKANINIS